MRVCPSVVMVVRVEIGGIVTTSPSGRVMTVLICPGMVKDDGKVLLLEVRNVL